MKLAQIWDRENFEKELTEFEEIRDGQCSSEAIKSITPLSMQEYNELGGGIKLKDSPTTLIPIQDSNGNLLHLSGRSVNVEFNPINQQFYPFEHHLLDLEFYMVPPSVMDGTYDFHADQSMFCISNRFTGFEYRQRSIGDNTVSEDPLQLVPYVSSFRVAP